MERLSALSMKAMTLDVTDLNARRRVRSQVEQITGGKLDILVNNAYVPYFDSG